MGTASDLVTLNQPQFRARHQWQIVTGYQIAKLSDRIQIGHLIAVGRQGQCDVRLIGPYGRMEGTTTGYNASNTLQYGEIFETKIDRVGQRSQGKRHGCSFLNL